MGMTLSRRSLCTLVAVLVTEAFVGEISLITAATATGFSFLVF
jgi:hypothetical protein